MESRPPVQSLVLPLALMLAVLVSRAYGADQKNKPAGFEFFERYVRPVLATHCYSCHSAQAKKLKGNLQLDSREAMLKGGDRGPAIVPKQPARSLVIEALRYENVDLRMPPRGKLPAETIEKLT